MSPSVFGYDPAIVERFPAIHAGVIRASGLQNGPSPDALLDEFTRQQASTVDRLADVPIADQASIAAWRRAFSAFGVKPTQHRSAAEAMLRRLQKSGSLPSINSLVDLGNLVSIRYGLPVAVFDQAHVAGGTTVRFAVGDESFTELGSTEAVSPTPGEVVFVDAVGVVSARRWCWRQSAQSAAGPTTVDALVVVEGLHDDADADVAAATTDLADLLRRHQPTASSTVRHLNAATPSFT